MKTYLASQGQDIEILFVVSLGEQSQRRLAGELSERVLVPVWVLSLVLLAPPHHSLNTPARANTQTPMKAIFNALCVIV